MLNYPSNISCKKCYKLLIEIADSTVSQNYIEIFTTSKFPISQNLMIEKESLYKSHYRCKQCGSLVALSLHNLPEQDGQWLLFIKDKIICKNSDNVVEQQLDIQNRINKSCKQIEKNNKYLIDNMENHLILHSMKLVDIYKKTQQSNNDLEYIQNDIEKLVDKLTKNTRIEYPLK